MKDPYYISPLNEYSHKIFFRRAKVGDYFQYSFKYSLEEIINMTRKCGIEVKYQGPGTTAFKNYGCGVVKVVKIVTKLSEPELFDPKMLII